MHRTTCFIALFLLATLLPRPACSQFIQLRISVKHILNASGQPPSGGGTNNWLNAGYWGGAIEKLNAGCARFGRGFRFADPVFEGGVSNAAQYFSVEDSETVAFEYAIRSNPQQYRFRDDALNVYVVQNNLGSSSAPECRGWASPPYKPLQAVPPYDNFNGRIVVLCITTGPLSVIPHEFGHHFGLEHTWVSDSRITDIPVDADPGPCNNGCACMFANTQARAAAQGWSGATLTLMTNNLMSYHCDINDDFDLSEGQLDIWCDMARRYLASEGIGVTYFVDRTAASFLPDGYSRSYSSVPPGIPVGGPFINLSGAVAAANSAGSDIVILRPGNFNEQITISKPVTLRATRAGWATIGKP